MTFLSLYYARFSKTVQRYAGMLKAAQTNRAGWNAKFVRSMYKKP